MKRITKLVLAVAMLAVGGCRDIPREERLPDGTTVDSGTSAQQYLEGILYGSCAVI